MICHISGALIKLTIQYEYTQTKCQEGARYLIFVPFGDFRYFGSLMIPTRNENKKIFDRGRTRLVTPTRCGLIIEFVYLFTRVFVYTTQQFEGIIIT